MNRNREIMPLNDLSEDEVWSSLINKRYLLNNMF